MIACISDIHGNLEALCAVLEDIESHAVREIRCLGDIVGYGPDPEACTDLVMGFARFALMGNHDFALVNDPIGFNPLAAEIILMTQKTMRPRGLFSNGFPSFYHPCVKGSAPVAKQSRSARWAFIRRLPDTRRETGILHVHASPLDPVFEYVFPNIFETGWNPGRIRVLLESVDRICFCGHTHIPCAIDSDARCIYPASCDYRLKLDPKKKYLINLGSVGQPRDRDTRASYILFDEDTQVVEWRRIEYDIDAVVKKIDDCYGKDNWCGTRLRLGR